MNLILKHSCFLNGVCRHERTYTAFKNKDGGVSVNRGCFNGTFKQFIDAVEAKHISTEFYHEYQAVIELTKARLSVEVEA